MVLGSLKGAPSEAFQGTDEEAKAEEDSDFLCIAGTWGALETGVCAWVPGLSLPQPRLSCTRTLVSASEGLESFGLSRGLGTTLELQVRFMLHSSFLSHLSLSRALTRITTH